jgi:predicted AlkP superfamily pyrophosphatase or phosphodiesterase
LIVMLAVGGFVGYPTPPAPAQDQPAPTPLFVDQGLNASEEPAFKKALKVLMKDEFVDMVVTVRQKQRPRAGCKRRGTVYWVYARRGTICFTRSPRGSGWRFKVQVVKGRNPVRKQSAWALPTLDVERRASSFVEDPERRNLIKSKRITYPYIYERIVAELDGPRAGDFVVVPLNTADRGGPGAHGHPGLPQSRTTMIVAGRGARRSPLSAKEEKGLRLRHTDVAPTVAHALGVRPYFVDTQNPATLLNGKPSETALLERQDGRIQNGLLEPVFNTFVISIDGLRPQYIEMMPNVAALLDGECVPGGACATSYEQARAMMVTETNGNHVAMMTGAYGGRSGIFANEMFDRDAQAATDLDVPALNLAETLFDVIEREKPWLTTASVMGKGKLRDLFDCTRDAEGNCVASNANPEKENVAHVSPDFIAGATTSPADQSLDCPAEPGSGSDYTTNACTMDAALELLRTEDPDLTFINLPGVDAFSHLFGASSPQAQAGVIDADAQIGRLVDQLEASNKWQHSILFITADHNFGDTEDPTKKLFLDTIFEGAGPAPFEIVSHGGSVSIYLTEVKADATSLTDDQQKTLQEIRKRALATGGVLEALYRLPNPLDGGARFTIDEVHPDWHLGGTARAGELLITGAEDRHLAPTLIDDDNPILGHHGHPSDRHIPFIVASGGTYVRDQSVAPSGEVAEADDTRALSEQAENVDIAPTVAWLYGLREPRQNQGRVLEQAFVKHPLDAQRDGDITEPIANRAAIFIFDQNNSVTLHCLMYSATCGDPAPEPANDAATVQNLRAMAEDGTFLRYGSVVAWPSVTMPNHNTVGSGVYPGHHGLVNNRFYLRQEKTVEAPIDPQDPRNPLYVGTSRYLVDEVETLHEAVHRSFGDWDPQDGPTATDAFTASVDEPSARGADYATLEPDQSFPNPAEYIATQNPTELAQDTTQSCAQEDPDGYGLESTLDHQGQTQARRLFDDTAQHPLPKYFINNFTLTDGAGHHFGVHTTCQIAAYRDSDRRFGRILDAMRSSGALGESLIVITGDHGSENQNLENEGLPSDFEARLNDAGIAHVMADWHVYLLTVDVASSPPRLTRGENVVTFTITDDDTDAGIEGATVEIKGATEAVTGTTDVEGATALTFTPRAKRVTVVVTAEGFNEARRRLRVRR